MSEGKTMKISYNLKSPCSDCPFTKSAKHHIGVAKDLVKLSKSLESKSFGHTCHKTDERSDGYVEGHKGPMEHCAGAMIMLKKMNHEQPNLMLEVRRGNLDPDQYEMEDDVFDSFDDMKLHYLPYVERLLKVSVRYTDRGRETVWFDPEEA